MTPIVQKEYVIICTNGVFTSIREDSSVTFVISSFSSIFCEDYRGVKFVNVWKVKIIKRLGITPNWHMSEVYFEWELKELKVIDTVFISDGILESTSSTISPFLPRFVNFSVTVREETGIKWVPWVVWIGLPSGWMVLVKRRNKRWMELNWSVASDYR